MRPNTTRNPELEHLLRRAGFGADDAELKRYVDLGLSGTLDRLLNYEQVPDDVDTNIGRPGFVGVTPARGEFSPSTNIDDARQRWLFRMVHGQRPLQEKMTLFWHNHFATAYSKVQGLTGGNYGARLMAAKPSEDPANTKGQLELLREHALGNFRDLLVAVSKDPAMLWWLDGRYNVKGYEQENYARELMELFTMGVGFFTESDVSAAARCFTGWNLPLFGAQNEPTSYWGFVYRDFQHDTRAKEFSFEIYPDGSRTIPARSAADGMQDGIDLINACARHPATAQRLARRLYEFFVSELTPPAPGFVDAIAKVYLQNNFEMKPVVRFILASPEFNDPRARFARYSWPVEYVVRALKEIGWNGFTLNDALTPLLNMGQQLFEPPDVAGWRLGKEWFSTGAMLARMNFTAILTNNQKINLREAARPFAGTAASMVGFVLDRMRWSDYDSSTFQALMDYADAGEQWSGLDPQVASKAAGLAHLVAGSAEYQFV